jgi:exopolyphosphatase/guanosine-5'-triphosphate,3'-diphosphate pyrophosphatase
MKLAVIDLGTNTCNLLIAETNQLQYTLLHQGKVGVKLGKGGINKNLLTPEAFERATHALNKHRETIRQFGVDQVVTIATSAVRDASNKAEFEAHLLRQTGLRLEIISGEREAELIFKGVRLAFQNLPDHTLIMDIGGGSNEFIEIHDNQIHKKESFPLGMARVLDQLPVSDPIKPSEVETIAYWFDTGMQSLWKQLNGKQVSQLIGCSGAFDTVADLIDKTAPGTKVRQQQTIALSDFNRVADKVIYSTKAQRDLMTGMEPLRVEMIVPALILIRLVIQKLNISKIVQTDYALREGILFEWIYD